MEQDSATPTLSVPVVVEGTGIIRFTWAEGLSATVKTIRQKGNQLTANCTIACSIVGFEGHVTGGSINLLAPSTRKQWARAIEERLGVIVDGSALMEQVYRTVEAVVMRGEPAILLRDVPARERVRWRVAPLIAEGELTWIYGQGGTMKSYLALLFCLMVDGPVSFLGLEPEPGTALYLDWESDKWTQQQRVRQLQAGLGLPAGSEHILYRRCVQPFIDDVERILEICTEHDVNLVVIDSMGMACGGEQKEEIIIPTLKGLRALDRTVIVIDHVSKEDAGRRRPAHPIGSIYKENEARSMYEARKVQELGSPNAVVGLYHRKVNNGKYQKPLAFAFSFSEDESKLVVAPHQMGDVPELVEGLPLQEQLAAILKGGKQTVDDLTAVLGATSEATIRMTLNRHKGRFQHLPDGSWGLADQGSER